MCADYVSEGACQTYAMIVGIEKNDVWPDAPLDGCNKSALKFYECLRNKNVPMQNMFLHLSPQTGKASGGKLRDIMESVHEKLKNLGDKHKALLVYWAGHGYANLEKEERRLYHADSLKLHQTLNVDSLVDLLASKDFGFGSLFVFVDCCASTKSEYQFPAPPLIENVERQYLCEQYVYFACTIGEAAGYGEEGGRFSQELFEELELEKRTFPLDLQDLDDALDRKFKELPAKHQNPVRYWFRNPRGDISWSKTHAVRVDICRLPRTDYRLFGRAAPLEQLSDSWNKRKARIASIVAMGGTGKTALASHWLQDLGKDATWSGAKYVFAWSFFSQGASTDRQVSSDLFITEAFKFFGVPDPGPISAWEKGQRLATAMRQQCALLVLDGLESLQEPPNWSGSVGRLRDQGALALLQELATGQSGLCVVTTRLPLVDLRYVHPDKHCEIDLGQLDETAGAELLRHLLAPPDGPAKQKEIVARTPENELRKASREFGGHALALRLLANYLATVHDSDIRCRSEICSILEEEAEGANARRVMRKYKEWFDGQPELDILSLLGLFDRPTEPGAVEKMREPPAIPGLTEQLQNLDNAKWKIALSHLRKAGLVTTERDGSLDCHPLVREYFGERLRNCNPAAWRAAHLRLYEYFRDPPTKPLPNTLEEMEPLYRSVAHGCKAGRHQEVFQKVYWARIARKNNYFSTRKLGAYGADLAVLSNLFQTPWNQPVDSLEPANKGLLFWLVSFRLRALGRLKEAVQPMEAALKAWGDLIDGAKATDPQSQNFRNTWRANAADNACNLGELFLILGEVQKALTYAEQSVKWADESGNHALGVTNRTVLGDALHQAGNIEKAMAIFSEAEALQKQRLPGHPYLESFDGFRYCELVLSRGNFTAVQEMVGQTLSREKKQMPVDVAMNHLSLGRAALLQAAKHESTRALQEALQHLNQAVQGLAGRQDHLPRGLLARAALHRVMGAFAEAWRDLAEAQEIAKRGEMKLHLADFHLEVASLFCSVRQASFQPQTRQVVAKFFRALPDSENLGTAGEVPSASFPEIARTKSRENLDVARQMIAETGYGRRKPELAELEDQIAGS